MKLKKWQPWFKTSTSHTSDMRDDISHTPWVFVSRCVYSGLGRVCVLYNCLMVSGHCCLNWRAEAVLFSSSKGELETATPILSLSLSKIVTRFSAAKPELGIWGICHMTLTADLVLWPAPFHVIHPHIPESPSPHFPPSQSTLIIICHLGYEMCV